MLFIGQSNQSNQFNSRYNLRYRKPTLAISSRPPRKKASDRVPTSKAPTAQQASSVATITTDLENISLLTNMKLDDPQEDSTASLQESTVVNAGSVDNHPHATTPSLQDDKMEGVDEMDIHTPCAEAKDERNGAHKNQATNVRTATHKSSKDFLRKVEAWVRKIKKWKPTLRTTACLAALAIIGGSAVWVPPEARRRITGAIFEKLVLEICSRIGPQGTGYHDAETGYRDPAAELEKSTKEICARFNSPETEL